MERASISLAILLLCTTLAPAVAAPGLSPYAPGKAETAFELPDLKDRVHALADYRGKVVLVNFWASWCPSCVYEMPGLERLRARFAGAPFEILTINVGEPKFKVWKFVKLVDFDLTVLLDSRKEVFGAWDMTVLPTTFLLDRNGQPRYRVQGAPDWDSEETLSVIRQLLQEETHDIKPATAAHHPQ